MSYTPVLSLRETQGAIRFLKHRFEDELCKRLNLSRASAPMFVERGSGLNDDLNGVERPVAFDCADLPSVLEVVHSLAKWKRQALAEYGYAPGEGIYTDMNAIRRDETLDALHSLYVDQWDWEQVIAPEKRNESYLKEVVREIYQAMKDTQRAVCERYPRLTPFLPENISFITTQELLDKYPTLSAKERENAAAREFGAVFLMQIGGLLSNGEKHDGRAPDYDDWSLNGDILVWYEPLGRAVELSSMGIRVDAEAMLRQLSAEQKLERLALPFHQKVMSGELPLCIGGGIGQSRLCMVLLHKVHIGEVQSSVWPARELEMAREEGIPLL